MISVSSSELGLGFAGIGEEDMIMEESDFEEESTHSYVSCVDPDVALSYIDEKLENVLGHFQKDFEGGVSAENLGAKFGGYGSFLSMYQRSPVCSSTPKTPLEAQNQMVSGSTSKTPASSSDVLVKLKKLVKSSDSKQKSDMKTSSSNHKTLRLRVKVGSSDLSSLKNGKEDLKMPPSTTSRVEEGLLYEIGDSPTKILMAMVSFPLHKDQLLSPLSDDLIQFGKMERITKDSGYVLGVSDAQKCAVGVKKEKVKNMPQSNKLDGNLIVSNTEKEIDKVSDSYVEDVTGRLRGNNVDVALMDSKPDVEDNVAAENVNKRKDVNRTEGETLSSLESKSKQEKAPSIERVDKVSQSEARNEEQSSKSKLRKTPKSQKSSSRNSLRGKDATVNITNKNVPENLQEDIGDLGGESKEEKLSSSTVLKAAEKEEVSEANTLKESLKSVKNYEEACNLVCETDSKHLIKSSDLNEEDKHNSKQNVKKPKTGKSRFSALEQPESNKTVITEASAKNVKDMVKASSRDRHDERKRKLKEENKENGVDCMRVKEEEAVVVVMEEPSGEKDRKQKRLKGSSTCDGKEELLLPFTVSSSSPSLCKDLGSDIIKTNLHEGKSSRRISEKDEHHDGVESNGVDRLKRNRDGSNIDKAAEISKDENGSIEKCKPKKSGRYSGENREENNRATTVNEVQEDVEVKAKESRSKKRHTIKQDSREHHQDPNTNGSDRAKTSRGKSNNHLEATVEKSKNQVQVLGHEKQISRNDNHHSVSQKQNGSSKLHKDHHVGLRSPLITSSQAASNSIKEATDLKHMADRLKNGGSNHESTSVYFQAALKFLHGASLLESSSSSSSSNNAKSRHIYGSTAKLCEFCAHEYEKNKDVGAAALAYKCMEVAYLRITYSSHGNISRYRHELQAGLQLIPPPPPSGESPSFVSSDGENPNHVPPNTLRSLSSPRVTGNNHVISSGNVSSLTQLLAFSQNVSYAMDASRKSQTAFATAKTKPFDNRYNTDGITSIKRALDFNFHDMEKLLHVVRLAMESINR